MTGPVQGVYTVRCESCGAVPHSSDETPHPDPMGELAGFAESGLCPRGGGAACPHSALTRADGEERRPEWIRQVAKRLRDRAPRVRRLVLPALVVGVVPSEVVVTWGQPMPDNTYGVFAQVVAPPELAGRITANVRAGSVTPEGVTLLVTAALEVAAGQARIHVMGVPT